MIIKLKGTLLKVRMQCLSIAGQILPHFQTLCVQNNLPSWRWWPCDFILLNFSFTAEISLENILLLEFDTDKGDLFIFKWYGNCCGCTKHMYLTYMPLFF